MWYMMPRGYTHRNNISETSQGKPIGEITVNGTIGCFFQTDYHRNLDADDGTFIFIPYDDEEYTGRNMDHLEGFFYFEQILESELRRIHDEIRSLSREV